MIELFLLLIRVFYAMTLWSQVLCLEWVACATNSCLKGVLLLYWLLLLSKYIRLEGILNYRLLWVALEWILRYRIGINGLLIHYHLLL